MVLAFGEPLSGAEYLLGAIGTDDVGVLLLVYLIRNITSRKVPFQETDFFTIYREE